MNYIWELPTYDWIVEFAIITLIYIASFILLLKISNRKASCGLLILGYILFLAAFIFVLEHLLILAFVFTGTAIVVSCISNIGELRKFISKPFHRENAKTKKVTVEKIYDSKELYSRVEKAVLALSKSKTGAIITFERNQSLKDFCKNGVDVNAPLSCELLETIFYPGTRLHDGAVIVRGLEVVSASVFFTPSTQPFSNKYGSRHRAAIGISEVSDSITVVVSEETGRISIACKGELEQVDQASFKKVLENYMNGDVK